MPTPHYGQSTGHSHLNIFDPATPGAHGQTFLSLTGGASSFSSSSATSSATGTKDMSHILQNLTMVIGNPSTRCYANAPWRAFCWMCAHLAEFNMQPWGTLKDAVQASIELSEPVDIKSLPGLEDLWKHHDLNTEGDAAHFINSLWIRSQTRVMQYRYSEIKEGGYLTEHVQLPLVVDYPEEFLGEITWQEIMNNWANQGLRQFLTDDKTVLAHTQSSQL